MGETSRRGLFGWLAALPFMPSLAKPVVKSVTITNPGMGYYGGLPLAMKNYVRLPVVGTTRFVSFDWGDFSGEFPEPKDDV